MQRIRLFVYGTLKRGFARAALMDGAVFIHEAMTQSGYALYDLGEYPALAVGAGTVDGEVYAVAPEHLEALDGYEGYPELYGRESIPLADGSEAVAYTMKARAVTGLPRVPGGRWQKRR